jgi:hypothetical protein
MAAPRSDKSKSGRACKGEEAQAAGAPGALQRGVLAMRAEETLHSAGAGKPVVG